MLFFVVLIVQLFSSMLIVPLCSDMICVITDSVLFVLILQLDIANTTIAITRRELTALRTENERLRRNTTTNSHNSGSSSSYKRPAPPNSYYHSYK